jgi:3-dehydroquinate dehydratase-2
MTFCARMPAAVGPYQNHSKFKTIVLNRPKFVELDSIGDIAQTSGLSAPLDPMAHLLLLHGPNLNLLGTREPEVYGRTTLAQIDAALVDRAQAAGHVLDCLQSNAEHALVERIHAAREDGTAYILINPAAFTHTSVALRDALLGVGLPFVEIHLSNPHAREPFRHHSYLSDKADGVICGFGADSYRLALEAVIARLERDA